MTYPMARHNHSFKPYGAPTRKEAALVSRQHIRPSPPRSERAHPTQGSGLRSIVHDATHSAGVGLKDYTRTSIAAHRQRRQRVDQQRPASSQSSFGRPATPIQRDPEGRPGPMLIDHQMLTVPGASINDASCRRCLSCHRGVLQAPHRSCGRRRHSRRCANSPPSRLKLAGERYGTPTGWHGRSSPAVPTGTRPRRRGPPPSPPRRACQAVRPWPPRGWQISVRFLSPVRRATGDGAAGAPGVELGQAATAEEWGQWGD